MQTHKLNIWHDYDAERPDENSIGRMVSFNNRHSNYEHPNEYSTVGCTTCDGNGAIEDRREDLSECPICEGVGWVDCELSTHPDVLATLSYYEHGLCRWMVGQSLVPDYGNFDTVNVAGVIVWNGDDDERGWWDALPSPERMKTLDGIAKEYTSWANGETYGFTLTTIDVCETCDTELEGETVESCGGFIGSEHLIQVIRDETLDGIDPSNIRIVGEYAYVVSESDLTPIVEVTAGKSTT